MQSYSISEIKKDLADLTSSQMLDLCLRLAKYKKENKELLGYLLFEAYNEKEYIEKIKLEMDGFFEEINLSNLYYTKKGLRKILKFTNRHIKFSSQKITEVELLIYFCQKIHAFKIQIHSSIQLTNLYLGQLKKINKAVFSMHEDVQFDYKDLIEGLAL